MRVYATCPILCRMVANGCTIGNGCFAQIGMPWFYRKLSVPVADDFEVCICKDAEHSNEDLRERSRFLKRGGTARFVNIVDVRLATCLSMQLYS